MIERLWNLFLEKLFGPGFDSDEPLRESLLTGFINRLLNPEQPNIITQDYFNMVGEFLPFAGILFFFELIVRLWRMRKDEQTDEEVKQLLISASFLLVFLGSVPGFILAAQKFSADFGRIMGQKVLGPLTTEQFVQQITVSSGNGKLDLVIMVIQTFCALVLSTWVFIAPVIVYLSTILLVIGFSVRFLGDVGAAIFAWCAMVAGVGVLGSGGIFLLMSFGVGAVNAAYSDPGDEIAKSMAMTGVLVGVLIALVVVFGLLRKRMKSIVEGIKKGVNKVQGKLQGGNSKSPGSDKRQADESARTRKRRTKQIDDQVKSATGVDTPVEGAGATSNNTERPNGASSTSSRTRHRVWRKRDRVTAGDPSATQSDGGATGNPGASATDREELAEFSRADEAAKQKAAQSKTRKRGRWGKKAAVKAGASATTKSASTGAAVAGGTAVAATTVAVKSSTSRGDKRKESQERRQPPVEPASQTRRPNKTRPQAKPEKAPSASDSKTSSTSRSQPQARRTREPRQDSKTREVPVHKQATPPPRRTAPPRVTPTSEQKE